MIAVSALSKGSMIIINREKYEPYRGHYVDTFAATVTATRFGRDVRITADTRVSQGEWVKGTRNTETRAYEIDAVMTNDETVHYAESSHWSNNVVGMATYADANGWSGFALVMRNGGDPIPEVSKGSYQTGHFCSHALDVTNTECTYGIIANATSTTPISGTAVWEFNGNIAYDYSNALAREAATSIEGALSDYPVLSDERMSELEYDNMADVLTNCYDIPDVHLSAVRSALLDIGASSCPDCSWNGWEISEALKSAGLSRCDECDRTILATTDTVLCRDCASMETDHDNCECVSVHVEHTPKEFFTRAELANAEKDCIRRHVAAIEYGTESDTNDVLANEALASLWRLANDDQEAQEALGEVLAWLTERDARTDNVPLF